MTKKQVRITLKRRLPSCFAIVTLPLLTACSGFVSNPLAAVGVSSAGEVPAGPGGGTIAGPLVEDADPGPSQPYVDDYECASGQPVTQGDYALTVAGRPNGNLAANAVSTDFSTPAATVFSDTNFGPSSYLAAADSKNFVAKSKWCSRDMEVSTWSKVGMVFLRLTDNGDGIYFFANANANAIDIGLVQGAREGIGFKYEAGVGNYIGLWGNSNMSALIPGYDPNGGIFTYGVSGMDIYAKYNGVEFMRIQDFRQVAPGRVALQAVTGYGFRDVAVHHMPRKGYYGDLAKQIYDLRDFGIKSVQTTGSVAAGSRQLTLAANVGFHVGDPIIVEIGTEAGQGSRGTVGVGGRWPALEYPTTAAMNADTSQAVSTYASVAGSPTVYLWIGGQWYAQTSYYVALIVPLSLTAKVAAVSADGRTLTLDRPAVAAATGANVYFDNGPAFNSVAGANLAGPIPDGGTVSFPKGAFAVGQGLSLLYRNGWTIKGAGKTATRIFSPKGTPSVSLSGFQVNHSLIRDLGFEGNIDDNGYGFGPSALYQTGVTYSNGANNVAQDLNIKNVWMKAFGASYETNTWGYRLHDDHTTPLQNYIQWMFQFSDSTGGGCVDCSVTSKYITPGFEAFRSSGVQFLRPVGVNAVFSMNSAGNFLIQDAYLSFTPNSQYMNSDIAFHHYNPIVNINSNIDNSSGTGGLVGQGGVIRNVTIIQQGYLNPRSDLLNAIVINAGNPNVLIKGGFVKALVPPVASSSVGGAAVNSTGPNTVVDGLIAASAANVAAYPGANIALSDSGSVSNCVADTLNVVASVTVSNCKTTSQVDPAILVTPPTP